MSVTTETSGSEDLAVADRVRKNIATLSPELQRAARWVSANPAVLSVQSMRRSAMAAGVLPVTMTRLAQALGYPGFEEMRQSLREELVKSAGQSHTLRAPRQLSDQFPEDSGLHMLEQAQLQNISSVIRRNSEQTIDQAADAILNAKSVLIMGLRASYGIAFHLHYCCQLLLPNTTLASNQAGTIADQVWRLGEDDLLVVASLAPYTRQTIDLAQQASNQGASVLALTDSELGPLGQCANLTLVSECDSPAFFHSMTGALAMGEALVSKIAHRGGEKTSRYLRKNRQRLRLMQAYWDRFPSE